MEKKKVFIETHVFEELPTEHDLYYTKEENGSKSIAWYMDDTQDWQSHPCDEQPEYWLKEQSLYCFTEAQFQEIVEVLKWYADSGNYTAIPNIGSKWEYYTRELFERHQVIATAYQNKKIENKAKELLLSLDSK
jgi:hypothetical protein